METKTVKAYGADSAETPLHHMEIRRRSLRLLLIRMPVEATFEVLNY